MLDRATTHFPADRAGLRCHEARTLPRRPGATCTVVRAVAATAGMRAGLVEVPEGADLQLGLRLESVTEGVLVSGTVSGSADGECARCLRPVSVELEVSIQELFAYPDSTTAATTAADEVGRLQDDGVDLEPAVRDAVVLALPSRPLCRDDCPGLCPGCGAHWDDLPAGHRHEPPVDPRWAALQQLKKTKE